MIVILFHLPHSLGVDLVQVENAIQQIKPFFITAVFGSNLAMPNYAIGYPLLDE
jgi:hypothetical protein